MDTPRTFSRIFVPVAALHALATVVAFVVLLYLTSGSAECHPSSPAITRAAFMLDWLGLPAAWPLEKMIYLDSDDPSFGVLVCLRLLNSVVVGAVVASLWTTLRPKPK